MIVDCHGHFTTAPARFTEYRSRQLEHLAHTGRALADPPPQAREAEIRAAIDPNQLARMKQRGVDVTIFSPRAIGMDHHNGDEESNVLWARCCNDLVQHVCALYPQHFAGACQLPQTAGVAPGRRVLDELERCVEDLGFVAANLNPDPTGGRWSDPPLSDRDWWYPLYERLVALDVPVMIHVSGSCNPHFHPVATHYINGDTTAFVQFLTSDVFKDFPELKVIIPHGGGAVPYHWGRYRGLAQDMGLGDLEERVLRNVYFDTCVYHQPGINLLLDVVPSTNVLFASETFGAVQGVDKRTGYAYDDTRRYIEAAPSVTTLQKKQVLSENAFQVFPRLAARVASWAQVSTEAAS